ncbi:hypothetical protein CC2G_002131 [Coprinopsis cinerea AmutBmut pab1-1]|nr:hypothetical protein CC2G_002131 [Coprinopsis cinerea AmutBmut pab1-1]
MSSANLLSPEHREHSESEPLRAAVDYSPEVIDKMKLPPSEEGDSQFKGQKRCTFDHDHNEQCHSALHSKQPMAHQKPIQAPKEHRFFNKDNPRPPPVKPDEFEWLEVGKK